MGQVLLLLVVALTVAAVVFGVTVLVSGRDPGLVPAEPDGRSVPLPGARPLDESDVTGVRFDTALRGYRMAQVDAALRRAAYDIGYKSELIGVLEAENAALREGRTEEADALRRAREEAATAIPEADQSTADPVTIDLSAPGPSAGAHHTGAGAADERPATVSGTGAGAAEAGVAEAPAAAGVEDTIFPTGASGAGPVGATGSATVEGERERGPVGATGSATVEGERERGAGDGSGSPAVESDRERGPAVRSESA